MKKLLFLLLPIIALGLLIGNKGTRQPQSQQVTPSTTQQQPGSNTSEMRIENNSIYVSGAGESADLTVTMVTLTDAGYVVIQADKDGQPGQVLGSSELLPPGSHSNVPIKLSRKTVNRETIYAALYKDNGDKAYTPLDETVKGTNGESMYMIVTVDAATQSPSGDVSL